MNILVATKFPGRAVFLLAALLGCHSASAFPELVRHGYANCITCHVSPNGGGVLTEYGRELSREILSTWGKEGESAFAYGLLKTPEWLNLGGDIRAVQVYRDTPLLREGRFIWMQADLEAAVTIKKVVLVGTVGREELPRPQSFGEQIISRRHYLNYRPTDELSFRAGRFYPAYGLNTPDHIISTRRGLGFDQGLESYNLEGAWMGESLNFYVTGIFGRPDAPSLNRATGLALMGSLFFAERYKTGLSYIYAATSTYSRSAFGPFGILGITPRLFLLSEFAGEMLTPSTAGANSTWRLLTYNRLNYEFIQGLHGYLTHEIVRPSTSVSTIPNDAYGLGVQFFPRPHFEFNLLWQKQRGTNPRSEFIDFAWLLFHFYL